MNLEKTLALAKKLKALAERGEGGEQDNARTLLDKLLKKHNMTIEELEFESPKYHDFNVQYHHLALFQQVISTVIGLKFEVSKYDERPNWYALFCTNVEAIEIEAKFEFYSALYEKELRAFFLAFVFKQDLGVKKSESNKPMTEEQRLDLLKAFIISAGIEKEPFHKQISKTGNDT